MTASEPTKSKALSNLEKAIILVMFLFLSTTLGAETFPNRPYEDLDHLVAILINVAMLCLSIRIIWRDSLAMKVFAGIFAFLAGILLVCGIRFALA